MPKKIERNFVFMQDARSIVPTTAAERKAAADKAMAGASDLLARCNATIREVSEGLAKINKRQKSSLE